MKTDTVQQNIPSGWKQVALGDLVSVTTGKRDANHGSPDGQYPFFTCAQKVSKIDNFAFDTEAVLIAGNGDFNVKYYKGKFDAYQRTYVLSGFKDTTGSFVYQKAKQALNEIIKNNQGSSVKFIKMGDLTDYPLLLPPIKEQQKIAEILGTVDEDIAKTQEVIEATERLKRGLMQQLFTRGIGHTKFKETKIGQIPEEWSVEKIGGHTTHVGSGSTPRGGSKVYLTEGIPFIRSQNVYFEGLIQEDLVYIGEHTHEEMSRSKTLPNDVLLNITGASIGRACVVPADLLNANVNQHVCIIRPSKNLLYKYLFYFLQSENGQNQIFKFQIGGNREGLNFQQIRSIEFPFPKNIQEQKEITEILFAVDEKISINKKLKEKLTLLKKGLMQDLLSGKVRAI